MKMTRWIGVLAASLLVTFVADEASAKKRRNNVKTETTADGYRYDFTDDPMTAMAGGVHAAQIKVRKAGVRRMLLRPRASFVPAFAASGSFGLPTRTVKR